MRPVFFVSIICIVALVACKNAGTVEKATFVATGQMPNVLRDDSANIHLVYGSHDSILIRSSIDQGKTFSAAALVAVVPDLAASHMRGPQIAAAKNAFIITACNGKGDIYSFSKIAGGQWIPGARVNDMDTVAKENLMALAANGENAFAVWLDMRNKHNQIYGARTSDGGKTWSENILVYASPDATVCECCRPSVVIQKNKVYVMFRNWLNGDRDLYLVQSSDAGATFGNVQKLGEGSWALKGCPMDGGAIMVNDNAAVTTVWNRKGAIYSCEPGKQEQLLGHGKSCTMSLVNDKKLYAWVEDGNVVVLKPGGEKLMLGKGQLPVIKSVQQNVAICMWENEQKIYSSMISL